ncbi:KRAB-A domain-containing protein 2-like [Palaemon carinicauda]|uniref:KRAB-A domain-containing protein 2-like n=1 Tax=Palaemon carinicauda TaxID=392227 RepID=UPI0035B6235F
MDQIAFEEKLRETQESKAENAVLQPTAKRDKLIEDLLRINSQGATSPFDDNLQKRYEILRVGNVDRLIRKRKDPANDVFKFVASIEEVFDIVKAAHEGIGHGGGKKTIAEVKKKWSNITQEVCYLYISFCEHCHQKKARKVPKGLVVKPVRSHHIFSRCQIDLINFQTFPDGDYKYIMTFVNHFSKFCVLRPLTTKRAEEVAANLLDIFLTFGAPAILQSDNGREFVNAVIAELSTLWPELKLVTGRPRHPQSQGAVERLNGVIQDKLAIWMQENNSKKWSVGLKFVQWQINISRHETTGHSPFKITFGQEPQVGLGSSVLPYIEEYMKCESNVCRVKRPDFYGHKACRTHAPCAAKKGDLKFWDPQNCTVCKSLLVEAFDDPPPTEAIKTKKNFVYDLFKTNTYSPISGDWYFISFCAGAKDFDHLEIHHPSLAWGGGSSGEKIWGGGFSYKKDLGGGSSGEKVWGGGSSGEKVWGGGSSGEKVWGVDLRVRKFGVADLQVRKFGVVGLQVRKFGVWISR